MKRKSSVPGNRGLKIAIFFLTLLVLLIGGALLIKGILLVARSKFDGSHQFVLLEKSGNNPTFLIFSPDTKSITAFSVTNISSDNAGKMLHLPVDASVTTQEVLLPKDLTKSLIFHFSSFHPTLTIVDSLRLFLFTLSVQQNNIAIKHVSYPLTDGSSQKTVTNAFLDQTIYKEGLSVSIINAADTSGLGTVVADLLSHEGVNVVSVTTAEKEEKTSSIAYSGHLSYTAQRIQKILHFPLLKQQGTSLSDIIITLGKREAGNF